MSDPIAGELDAALAALRGGGLVAFPTETVWGLAARASSEDDLAALVSWKGRDEGKPMAVLVSAPDRLDGLGICPPSAIAQVLARFWPGPLTVVFPGVEGLAKGVANAAGGVGVRCSPHPTARALAAGAEAAGLAPLTATSLNKSGEAPARTRAEARALVEAPAAGKGPVLLGAAGEDAGGAAPSTVLDLSGPRPTVVREGAIPYAVLEAALAEVGLALALAPAPAPAPAPGDTTPDRRAQAADPASEPVPQAVSRDPLRASSGAPES